MKDKKLCLVVDDDQLCREINCDIATALGFEVHATTDGIEAIDFCKKQMPDLIFLDYMMPNMNGKHFLVEINEHITNKTPYILMCSGAGQDNPVFISEYVALTTMFLGADQFISKPFKLSDIEKKLKDAEII